MSKAPLFAALSCLIVLAPACDDAKPPPKAPENQVDPGEQAKLDEGRRKIDEAGRAIDEKKYDRARKLLGEARKLAVESQRYEVDEAFDKLDKRQAKLWWNEVAERLQSKDCLGALAELSEPIQAFKSETFERELRKLLGNNGFKCLQAAVDEQTMANKFDGARKVLDRQEVAAVLGDSGVKKLRAELEVTVLEALKQQFAGELKARRWQAAVDKIDAAKKRGDATDDQARQLLEVVRQGVTPELLALTNKAGQNDAPAALKQFDASMKVVRWEVASADVAAIDKDKALPPELSEKRTALAVWVEGQRAGFRALPKAEQRWTLGRVSVAAPEKLDGAAIKQLQHGTVVFVLGVAKDRALVAEADPGAGSAAERIKKALGWAPLGRLERKATTDWLVPDDQLKGERVWAPLRPPDTLLELGYVTEVAGQEVSVKRIADDVVIKVPRRNVRSGRLPKGTKVVTFCTAKDQPAQVLATAISGRTVSLKCDGGEEKEEQLTSLRSKLELLPVAR